MTLARSRAASAILCGVVWILPTYIALDYLSSRSLIVAPPPSEVPPSGLCGQLWRTQAEGSQESERCRTLEGHSETDDDYGKEEHAAWSQMKWIGKPAACRVRGELIERLDPLNNFRRGFALQFAGNVEDRAHIVPWFLGSKIDLNRRQRRVFLDLGSNTFTSSILWFIQMYPVDFTEIHAFEITPGLLQIPQGFPEHSNWAQDNPASLRTKARPGVPSWMLERIKAYDNLVSDEDDGSTRAINITRFIKEELQLSAQDTVIVKMDIEGSEWPILTRWLNDPEMVRIVDEIFVEVHYNHPTMSNYHWGKFKRSRDEATELLASLRWKGFYSHFWP